MLSTQNMGGLDELLSDNATNLDDLRLTNAFNSAFSKKDRDIEELKNTKFTDHSILEKNI